MKNSKENEKKEKNEKIKFKNKKSEILGPKQ
jgi:hypothetical protein